MSSSKFRSPGLELWQMKKILLPLLIFSCLSSQEIELFMDWQWTAKGQEIFPLHLGARIEDLSLESQIRRRLMERGWEIRSWKVEKYRPWLLTWNEVHSWADLIHWLGWGLPREEPMLNETKYWVFWSLGKQLRNFSFERLPKERMALFIWEPSVVQEETYNPKLHACFGKIFTWDDDLVDGVKYFKFHYPVLRARLSEIPSFEEKKFCTLINSRLSSKHPKQIYKEREKAIEFFEEKPGEFDLYGRYWEKRNYRNYRGVIGDKLAVLKNYKFSICYENTKGTRGYVTEKIFDCFAAGVVPAYWGASNIEEYVPADCFIDRRRFKDTKELYEFMKAMSKEEYEGYLERAAQFLKSEKAKVFSSDHFIETFVNGLTIQNPSS